MKVTPVVKGRAEHAEGCVICGKPLVYGKARIMNCALCGKVFQAGAACEAGHYVCDKCHAGGVAQTLEMLKKSRETDPVKLFLQAAAIPGVHMHGPEHHVIVPAVLLTAYSNLVEGFDLNAALEEALRRGGQVPGGACGSWGVCGAAIGAGIYAGIVTGSDPLSPEHWKEPIGLSSRCLTEIARVGGVRCCKRTGRLAIEQAALWTRKNLGVDMPCSRPRCGYSGINKECLRQACPFFGGQK